MRLGSLVLTGWASQGLSAFMRYVTDGGRPVVPESMSMEYAKLMQACWSNNTHERPPFDDVVAELQQQVDQMTELEYNAGELHGQLELVAMSGRTSERIVLVERE